MEIALFDDAVHIFKILSADQAGVLVYALVDLFFTNLGQAVEFDRIVVLAAVILLILRFLTHFTHHRLLVVLTCHIVDLL